MKCASFRLVWVRFPESPLILQTTFKEKVGNANEMLIWFSMRKILGVPWRLIYTRSSVQRLLFRKVNNRNNYYPLIYNGNAPPVSFCVCEYSFDSFAINVYLKKKTRSEIVRKEWWPQSIITVRLNTRLYRLKIRLSVWSNVVVQFNILRKALLT